MSSSTTNNILSSPATISKSSFQLKKQQPLTAWLRHHTSWLDWGKKTPDFKSYHINTKLAVKQAFDSKDFSGLLHLRNIDIERHSNNEATVWFTGNHTTEDPETLVMLETDCHLWGNLRDAKRFLKELAHKYKFDAYVERSPRGWHCYIVIRKDGRSPFFINKVLRELHELMGRKKVAEHWNIEHAEVKGTAPELSFADDHKLHHLKMGMPASLPRNLKRFDKWRLRAKPIPAQELHKIVTKMHDEYPAPVKSITVKKDTTVVMAGSVTGKAFNDAELAQARIGGHYWRMAESLLNHKILNTKGGAVVTVADLAIALMIGRYLTRNIASNGAMPWACWKGLWTALKGAGDIDRQFCATRFATIKHYLSSLGLLEWKNPIYKIGETDESGVYHKGFASKWKFNDELMQYLDWEREQKREQHSGENREASTSSTTIPDFDQTWELFVINLVQVPFEQVIRCVEWDDWIAKASEVANLMTQAA